MIEFTGADGRTFMFFFRSAKQCRLRYETVIVPREEGRILYDLNPRKQKKTKGLYKVYAVCIVFYIVSLSVKLKTSVFCECKSCCCQA